jgi:hypothetical protein
VKRNVKLTRAAPSISFGKAKRRVTRNTQAVRAVSTGASSLFKTRRERTGAVVYAENPTVSVPATVGEVPQAAVAQATNRGNARVRIGRYIDRSQGAPGVRTASSVTGGVWATAPVVPVISARSRAADWSRRSATHRGQPVVSTAASVAPPRAPYRGRERGRRVGGNAAGEWRESGRRVGNARVKRRTPPQTSPQEGGD